jgi:hypothetical protein
LGQNNQVHGLTVGNTTGIGISGLGFGALVVRDVDVTGSGQALGLSSGDINAIFGELSSASGQGGIRLDRVSSGTLSHTAASSLSGNSGAAVGITESSVAFAYDGDISNSGFGIILSSNSGSTIDFTGTLTLTTANNAAFVATSGGTVTSTGAGSTIETTIATPLTISAVTIGSSGITFESISATGAQKGIVLNGAGSGGFTVTGSGSVDASGGTIGSIAIRGVEIINTDNVSLSNLTMTNTPLNDGGSCTGLDNSGCNAAVYLNGVTGVSLTNLDVTGAAQQGINGLNVADLTLDGSTITSAGNAVNEGGVRLFNLSGTVAVTNNTVSSSAERNVFVRNSTGTLAMSVSDNSFTDTQSSVFGADGLEIELGGNAQLALDVDNNQFLRNRTNGLQVIAEEFAGAVAHIDVTNNTFDPGTGIGRAIDLATSGSATLEFNVIGNPKIYSDGGTALNVRAFGTSTVRGRINDNPDIQTDRTFGGPSGGSGISVGAVDNSTAVVLIDNNDVSNIFQDIGIQVFSRDPSGGTPSVDATVSNNNVKLQGGGAFPLYGVEVRALEQSSMCANVSNNFVEELGGGLAVFRARQRDSALMQLQGFNTNATTTWINNGNTPAGPVSELASTSFAAGTCDTVTHPLP